MAGITEIDKSDEDSVVSSDSASPTNSIGEEASGAVQPNGDKAAQNMPSISNERDDFTIFGEMVGAKLRTLDRYLHSHVKQEILNSLDSAELATAFHQEEIRRKSAMVSVSAPSSFTYDRRPIERELDAFYSRPGPSSQSVYTYSQSSNLYSTPPQGNLHGFNYSAPQPTSCTFFPPTNINISAPQMPYSSFNSYSPQPSLLVPYLPNQHFVPRNPLVAYSNSSYPGLSYPNPPPSGNFGSPMPQSYSNPPLTLGPAHHNQPPNPAPMFKPPTRPVPLQPSIEPPSQNVMPSSVFASLTILRRNEQSSSGMSG